MSGAELYLVAKLVSAGVKYAKTKSDAKKLKSQAYQAEIKGRVDILNKVGITEYINAKPKIALLLFPSIVFLREGSAVASNPNKSTAVRAMNSATAAAPFWTMPQAEKNKPDLSSPLLMVSISITSAAIEVAKKTSAPDAIPFKT